MKRLLIHDFAGHPFQVQLSRALARKGFNVLHVYSKSIQTPKGSLHKKKNDSNYFNIIGISQEKPFPKYSLLRRWIAEQSYGKKLLRISTEFKPDIVISSNTPLDIQKQLCAQCRINKTRFIFWLQDIYSMALHQALKKKFPFIGDFIARYYNTVERALLNRADHIVAISEDFSNIIRKWVTHNKIIIIENWAPLDEIQPQLKNNHWSILHNISEKFCFLYAGTLGLKHNPNVLIQLARQFRNQEDATIIILSEGIGVEFLRAETVREQIHNIKIFRYINFELLQYALSSADVLIAILDTEAGGYCVPSKVLTYHCIGKPLLLSVPRDNLASKIVKKQKSGLVIDPDDVDGFCRAADKLKNDKKLRIQMGKNARKYAENAFNIDKKCESFIQILK